MDVPADDVQCSAGPSGGDMSIEETVTIINELNALLSKDDGAAPSKAYLSDIAINYPVSEQLKTSYSGQQQWPHLRFTTRECFPPDFREIEALRKKHADIEALCSAQLLETKELIRREFFNRGICIH